MKKNLKYLLKDKLTKEQLEILPTSYDVIGSILIFIDFPKELKKKEKIIAQTVLDKLPNIKTILKKTKKHSGKYRLPKYKFLAGIKTFETIYRENNIRLKLNIKKVYFSPRSSTERTRIYNLVKNRESVLVMFSGSAIYPLVISKNSKPHEVQGIEINPTAHKFALQNVELNKLNNIFLHKGNVNKILPKLNKKFDRILMPLPMGAEKYLQLALKYVKDNGTIHFYYFSHEHNLDKAKELIKKLSNNTRINKITKCGQFGPGIFRYCFDLKVTHPV